MDAGARWEKLETTEYMERSVKKAFEKIDANLTHEERKGQIDTGYRSTAGKHVMIERKRPEVMVSV